MPTASTPLLEIAYEDAGPADAPAVLLLHGWPDAPRTWAAVAARLNAAGLRTLTPALRGFGGTRFRSGDTPRTGDSAVLALDALDFLDAVGVGRVMVAGHDWGSNAAEAMAVAAPERVTRLALLSTPPRLGGMPTPPLEQCQRQWYHWFQATARGAEAVRTDPKGFAHLMWVNWSPPGWFEEDEFARTAQAWENPDWVEVTLHSYRSRWDEADPDLRSRDLDAAVKRTRTLPLPTLYLHGEADGVNPPSTAEDVARKFTGPFRQVRLAGVGHFPTREAPDATAEHLISHFRA